MLLVNRTLYDQAGDGTGGGGDGSGSGADGKPGAATFDPVAFKTDLLADFTKVVQGALKAQKTDFAKLIQGNQQQGKPPDGQGSGSGDGAGNDDTKGGADGKGKPTADPVLAAQLRKLEGSNKELMDQVKALRTESDTTKADADKKDLSSQVRSKLSTKFKFADEAALEDAFEIFSPKVKRDSDSNAIVGHDGTPIDQYLEEQMRTRAYLLAPKDVSGAGGRNGKTAGKRTFTLEDIDNIKKPVRRRSGTASLRHRHLYGRSAIRPVAIHA